MQISHYNSSMCIVKEFMGTQNKDASCTALAFSMGSTEKEAVESFLRELKLMRARINCAIKEAENYLEENDNARKNDNATEENDRA